MISSRYAVFLLFAFSLLQAGCQGCGDEAGERVTHEGETQGLGSRWYPKNVWDREECIRENFEPAQVELIEQVRRDEPLGRFAVGFKFAARLGEILCSRRWDFERVSKAVRTLDSVGFSKDAKSTPLGKFLTMSEMFPPGRVRDFFRLALMACVIASDHQHAAWGLSQSIAVVKGKLSVVDDLAVPGRDVVKLVLSTQEPRVTLFTDMDSEANLVELGHMVLRTLGLDYALPQVPEGLPAEVLNLDPSWIYHPRLGVRTFLIRGELAMLKLLRQELRRGRPVPDLEVFYLQQFAEEGLPGRFGRRRAVLVPDSGQLFAVADPDARPATFCGRRADFHPSVSHEIHHHFFFRPGVRNSALMLEGEATWHGERVQQAMCAAERWMAKHRDASQLTPDEVMGLVDSAPWTQKQLVLACSLKAKPLSAEGIRAAASLSVASLARMEPVEQQRVYALGWAMAGLVSSSGQDESMSMLLEKVGTDSGRAALASRLNDWVRRNRFECKPDFGEVWLH